MHDQPDSRPRARATHGRRTALAAALALAIAILVGCGGGRAPSNAARLRGERDALAGYLRQVEPVRLAVNSLPEGADPILSAYAGKRLSPARAARRMGALERRFAEYAVQIAAIEPRTARLRALQASYAHTYVLEDSYLSALTEGLAQRKLEDLPDTQSAQRAAIIEWRTGLTVLARRVSLRLPPDLQRAGRGEIAPSPVGS